METGIWGQYLACRAHCAAPSHRNRSPCTRHEKQKRKAPPGERVAVSLRKASSATPDTAQMWRTDTCSQREHSHYTFTAKNAIYKKILIYTELVCI